jgi:uncharacterized protein YdeI (YjbR/CyaY-like superfamily)
MSASIKPLQFATAEDFRLWLERQGPDAEGVWLLFGKKGGPRTLTAAHALEEALCCGWIDGQMKSLDELRYQKYFAPRRKGSQWSEKNKALAAKLEQAGRMSAAGRAKVEEARCGGAWDAPPPERPGADAVELLLQALQGREPACGNYQRMSPSVRRTYAMGYLAAKSEETRARRLEKIVERLNQNLKPM